MLFLNLLGARLFNAMAALASPFEDISYVDC
jgi:threonine aldolase